MRLNINIMGTHTNSNFSILDSIMILKQFYTVFLSLSMLYVLRNLRIDLIDIKYFCGAVHFFLILINKPPNWNCALNRGLVPDPKFLNFAVFPYLFLSVFFFIFSK